MAIDAKGIEAIVRQVLETIDEVEAGKQPVCDGKDGIFQDINDAIEAAHQAWVEYFEMPLSMRAKIVAAIREIMTRKEVAETIAQMAVDETGMGNFEHKVIKQIMVSEKTPGLEDLVSKALSGDDGLTLVEYSPFGVIGAICPTTNPNETIIGNSICMLTSGNAVVFAPHPNAINVSNYTVRLINQAIASVGGPKNLVCSTEHPTIESSNQLMKHPKVRLLCATGGPGIVKAVLSSGKKAIGAGAGNPPALVDETADIEKAAKDIIDGCCFDNNLPCIAEKEVIAVEQIADYLIFNMKKNGGYEITDMALIDKLTEMVIPEGRLNRGFVGKSAKYIAEKLGIQVPDDTRVLFFQAPADHTLVVEELMMPILGVVRVKDCDEGIELAIKLEHGNRHTAIMHSKNVDKLSKCARKIQTTIFVKNGPSYAGLGVGGEGYPTFTIAGPTGEGLTSPKSFARIRKCVLCGGLSIK